MSIDTDLLEDWLDKVADRWTAAELIDMLEDAGLVDVYLITNLFKEELIEIKERLEQ